jgi:hypothetical protein
MTTLLAGSSLGSANVPAPRPTEPDVLEPGAADELESPRSAAAATGTGREAALRIALFVLVLVLACGAAWGAGRVLSAGLAPAGSGHDMSDHDMSDHDMSGMDMTEMPGMSGGVLTGRSG